MIRRVSSLIYEFEFSNNMNIYPVISVIYLKLVSKGNDFSNHFHNDYLVLVEEDLWNNIEKNNGNSKSRNLRIVVKDGTVEVKKLLNI
jgi:hypothetical protein